MKVKLKGVKVKISRGLCYFGDEVISSTITHSGNILDSELDLGCITIAGFANIEDCLESVCFDTLRISDWLGIPRTEIEFENLLPQEVDFILNYEI